MVCFVLPAAETTSSLKACLLSYQVERAKCNPIGTIGCLLCFGLNSASSFCMHVDDVNWSAFCHGEIVDIRSDWFLSLNEIH